MLARFVLGSIAAAAVIAPAFAGTMSAEEARKFVAGKVFTFTCFDGTRGAGRILDDMGATGAVQFSGAGPIRHVRLPGNTLQVRGQAVCASLRGLPFEPCFNLDKTSEVSFRGSVSGMGFAYCDFHNQGATQMMMARAIARPRTHRAEETTGSAAPRSAEVASHVETPHVDHAAIEPVRSEPKPDSSKADSTKADSTTELRRSTD